MYVGNVLFFQTVLTHLCLQVAVFLVPVIPMVFPYPWCSHIVAIKRLPQGINSSGNLAAAGRLCVAGVTEVSRL